MIKRSEFLIVSAATIGVTAFLIFIARKHGVSSENMAAWLQAVGSIAAICLVTLPVIVEQRLKRIRSKKLVIATAEMAYGTMNSVAERRINANYSGSEWWVPQWEILDAALAKCPIFETESETALTAFVFFQECFNRAKAFDDAPEGAEGFIISTTLNAQAALADLKIALSLSSKTKSKSKKFISSNEAIRNLHQ